jgi:transcriptional regulator with XRE-family HTH domain
VPRSHRSESAAVDATFARGGDWLAANVRAARARAGLTQLDLAERAEISVNYLQHIERPGSSPNVTLRMLASLATSLGVALHELLQPATTANARTTGRPRGRTGKTTKHLSRGSTASSRR